MSTSSQQRRPTRSARPQLLTPSRIVILILILALVIIAPIELGAQSKCGQTYTALDARMVEGGEGLCKKDIELLLVGNPARQDFEEDGVEGETFTWNGLFRSYQVRVYYEGINDFVKRIEQN